MDIVNPLLPPFPPPHPHPRMFSPKSLHALIDIGEFLLGFTIENIEGGFEARGHVFHLDTRAWLKESVPILPSERDGPSMPIDGKWEMKMINYTSLLCIYSNQSKCRLIRLHLDRSPTTRFPLSIFIVESRDIRPVHHSLIDRSFACTVLYERENERIAIVTDDNQEDHDSVRVFEMNSEGEMEYLTSCNLTNTTFGFVMARSAEGDILMTGGEDERESTASLSAGILVNRLNGGEKMVEIQGWNGLFPNCPNFKIDCTCILLAKNGTFLLDDSGEIWSLSANLFEWRKYNVNLSPESPAFLTLTNGRFLCAGRAKHRDDPNMILYFPAWKWMLVPSLKELAQTALDKWLKENGDYTDVVHSRMKELRRGYDTTTAFVLSIGIFMEEEKKKEENVSD
ncbi:hypothetical protein PENTCL1PPCAC_26836 [Pristionchus entomophagus]|uniref:Uncharacterized protein n=1 Tax=Pristionchus entomophagus TaxID=358040 RepID=A0AAV5UEA7_9BILA|nr:hypothetical protein PENTCL1PPCAC_26836 [Pristionchus entomophagus]